jgi:hypothetical protein
MPAGAGAYCWESPDRLKPGLQSCAVRITISTFMSRWMPAGAGAYCWESPDRLKPGLHFGAIWTTISTFISR